MRANGTASDVRFCYRFREKASPPQFGKIILALEKIRSFPQTVAKGCWGCCWWFRTLHVLIWKMYEHGKSFIWFMMSPCSHKWWSFQISLHHQERPTGYHLLSVAVAGKHLAVPIAGALGEAHIATTRSIWLIPLRQRGHRKVSALDIGNLWIRCGGRNSGNAKQKLAGFPSWRKGSSFFWRLEVLKCWSDFWWRNWDGGMVEWLRSIFVPVRKLWKHIQKSPGQREKASFWHGDSSCNVCLLNQWTLDWREICDSSQADWFRNLANQLSLMVTWPEKPLYFLLQWNKDP